MKILFCLSLFLFFFFNRANAAKENEEIVWEALIEVHELDGGTNGIDPILYAQRKGEILLSRSVLQETNAQLLLSTKWGFDEEETIKQIKSRLTVSYTKGGLISIRYKAPNFDSDDHMLECLIRSYRRISIKRLDELHEFKLDQIKRLRQEQEAKVADYRTRYFTMARKFKIKMTGDFEKLSILEQTQLSEMKQDYEKQKGNLANLEDESTKLVLEYETSPISFYTIHSKPYVIQGYKQWAEAKKRSNTLMKAIEEKMKKNEQLKADAIRKKHLEIPPAADPAVEDFLKKVREMDQ